LSVEGFGHRVSKRVLKKISRGEYTIEILFPANAFRVEVGIAQVKVDPEKGSRIDEKFY
jgi:hypothetical protein